MLNVPDHLCRYAPYYYISRYIFGNYGTSCNYGVVSDGDPRENSGIGADPHVFADHNGGWEIVVAVCRVQVVVDSGEDYIVADEGVVPDGNTALILEPAAGVDEDVLTDLQVLATICGEGGEEIEGAADGTSSELGHDSSDLFWGVVCAVQLCCELERLLRQLGHVQVDL